MYNMYKHLLQLQKHQQYCENKKAQHVHLELRQNKSLKILRKTDKDFYQNQKDVGVRAYYGLFSHYSCLFTLPVLTLVVV